MEFDFSRIEALKEALSRDADLLETLQSLNLLLGSSSNAEILRVSSVISPEQIFHLLATQSNPEVIDLVCAVISKMLLPVPNEEITKMSQYLELGLQHENERVRSMTLQILTNRIASQEFVEMVSHPTMFHLITQLLGDESLECAKHSTKLILSLAKHPDSGKDLMSSLIKGLDIDLKGLIDKSSVVRYRVFDLVVGVASINEAYFDHFEQLGYFSALMSDLHSNDVLLKLNCLEVMEVLMSSQYGCRYVERSDVIKKLHTVLEIADMDPLSAILIPGILKFFGHYCKYSPAGALSVCSQHPLFVRFVLTQITEPQDDTQLKVAMDTFSLLGSAHDLRPILLTQRNYVDKAVRKLWEYSMESKSNLQINALNVLAAVFSCETDPNLLHSDWFDLHPSTRTTALGFIMEIVKRPFSDLQLSGLRLILSISTWEWGQRHINKCPGMVEYLLDRKTSSDKEGKQLKFEIISSLSNSSTSENIFGSSIFLKFKQYVREGVFYVAQEELSIALDEL